MNVSTLIATRVNHAMSTILDAVHEFDDGRLTGKDATARIRKAAEGLAGEMFDFGFNVGVNTDPSDDTPIGEIELEHEE